MIPVESSNIKAVDYKPTNKELLIEFNNGGLYTYSDVPKRIFDGLIAADSKGKYFWKHIRGKFSYERIENGH